MRGPPGELKSGSLKLWQPSGSVRSLQKGCRTTVGTGPRQGGARAWQGVPTSLGLHVPAPANREVLPESRECAVSGVSHRGATRAPTGQEPTLNSCHPDSKMPSYPGSRKNFLYPLRFLHPCTPTAHRHSALTLGRGKAGRGQT